MPLLTIEETAKELGCSARLVRRSIDRTRDGLPGGWPSTTWVNLTPAAGKATVRVDLEALLIHLRQEGVSHLVSTGPYATR